LTLPVSEIARQLLAELFLPSSSEVQDPVRKGAETLLDLGSLQSVPAQFGAHAPRSLAAPGMKGYEAFRVTPIVEESFGAQRVEQHRHDRCIVTLLEQFTSQFSRRVVTAGERVERRRSGRARIERFDLLATQVATPL